MACGECQITTAILIMFRDYRIMPTLGGARSYDFRREVLQCRNDFRIEYLIDGIISTLLTAQRYQYCRSTMSTILQPRRTQIIQPDVEHRNWPMPTGTNFGPDWLVL
jgi:hypothetical protein